MAADKSYPASEVRGGGWEETPHIRGQDSGREELPRVRGQGRRLGGAILRPPRSGAEVGRSYPAFEVRGGPEETPRVRSHGLPGEATSHPRPRAVYLRSHPKPEARGSSWEEPPMSEAKAVCQEEHPKEWWLPRHRRA